MSEVFIHAVFKSVEIISFHSTLQSFKKNLSIHATGYSLWIFEAIELYHISYPCYIFVSIILYPCYIFVSIILYPCYIFVSIILYPCYIFVAIILYPCYIFLSIILYTCYTYILYPCCIFNIHAIYLISMLYIIFMLQWILIHFLNKLIVDHSTSLRTTC